MPTRHRYVLSLNGKEEVTKGEGKGDGGFRERDRIRRNGTIEATGGGESGSVKAQVVKTAKVDV